MSKQKSLLIGIGIVAALVIGFLIGISVESPRLNQRSLSGTIGKVNNYRNTQVSEADILLKNELLTDTAKVKMLRGYFNFYYVGALKMTADVELAVKEATAIEAFQVSNKSLTASLESYGKFLLSARTDLLMALAACKSVKEANPILLRNTLNQARNVVAQINYRDRIVLDFVDALSTFIKSNEPVQFQGLEKAHDLLIANEVYNAMITKNKAVLKFLDKTVLFSKSQESLNIFDQQKLSMMIQQDMEKLAHIDITFADAEKLNSFDAEKLKSGDAERLRITDTEKLKSGDAERLSSADAEKLGGNPKGVVLMPNDAEKLAQYNDAEKLNVGDAEKLGHYTLDSEKLGIYGDATKLGQVAGDAEKLGAALFKDTEKLRCDVEKLGVTDMEKLGRMMINDAEVLGGYQIFGFDAEKLGRLMIGDGETLGARPVAFGSNNTIMGKGR
jgi:hypothetical protein